MSTRVLKRKKRTPKTLKYWDRKLNLEKGLVFEDEGEQLIIHGKYTAEEIEYEILNLTDEFSVNITDESLQPIQVVVPV